MKEKIEKFTKKYVRQLLAGCVILVCMVTLGLVIGQYERKADETVSIVYIPKVRNETDFWVDVISGAESAAKEYQVDLEILAPDEEKDVERQKDCIRQAIKMKPDVIALSPSLYSEMTDVVKEIVDAGIPLVLVDSKIDRDLADSYIGTDNVDAGIRTGRKALELIDEDTKIAIISQSKGASTAMEREEGVRTGLGDAAKRIETVLYCDSDYQIACDLTKALLTEQPDIKCIIGLNLPSTTGAAKAVKDMDLEEEVTVVGLDHDMEGVEYLEMGVIDALVVQKPFHMGYFGIKTAAQIARGEKVESVVYTETEIVTMDNLYSQEIEKLLFGF